MSFKTWVNYGYGVCTDDLPINNDNIEELMSRAPVFLEACNRYLEENRCVDCPRGLDYFDAEDINYGIATILAEVILEAEGLYFTACDDFDSKTYLIYQPRYPWEMSERDSVMTEKRLLIFFANMLVFLLTALSKSNITMLKMVDKRR